MGALGPTGAGPVPVGVDGPLLLVVVVVRGGGFRGAVVGFGRTEVEVVGFGPVPVPDRGPGSSPPATSHRQRRRTATAAPPAAATALCRASIGANLPSGTRSRVSRLGAVPEESLRLLVLGGVFIGLYVLTRLPIWPRVTPPTVAPPPPEPPRAPPAEVGERFELDALLAGAVQGLDRVRRVALDRPLVVRAPAGFPAALRDAVQALRAARREGALFVHADRTMRGDVLVKLQQAPHEHADQDPLDAAAEARFARVEVMAHAVMGGPPKHPSRPPALWFSLPLDESTPPDPRGLSRFDDGVRELPWAERYAVMLERVAWRDLHHDVFRYAAWAERVARYAARHGLRRALCPSVGLNVDPWLLAAAGLHVVAFDAALPAVRAVAHPGRLPQAYSATAHEAWEVYMTCAYDRGVNPHTFGGLPDLGRPDVVAELAPRVLCAQADWARVPLADASVDLVHGCNALPREDEAARAAVLAEWARVLRPGGLVMGRVHNAYGIVEEARAFFARRGLREVDLREPDAPPPGPIGAFHIHGSSG